MLDPETRAYLDGYRERALSAFPLSRVTRTFHDAMLDALPPAHKRGIPGFFVPEALTDGIHAQFVDYQGRCYGAYVDIRSDPRERHGPITTAKIEAWRADPACIDSARERLAWYPPF